MSFLRRLGYFMIGLSIGLIFLAFFLRKKSDETGVSFCYLPNCRVLKELRSKPQTYSEDIRALIDNSQLDSLQIARFLSEGDVDFGRSETKSTPCKTYFIEGQHQQRQAVLEVRDCESAIRIVALQ